MREILFRAKAINRDKGYHRTNYKNGDWVYGLITRLYDERFENLPAEMTDENGVSGIEIDHNTICQYTGLTDKNGNKIWENDVVRQFADCNEFGNSLYFFYQIKWNEEYARFYGKEIYCKETVLFDELEDIEVLGNIFDNAELIEG